MKRLLARAVLFSATAAAALAQSGPIDKVRVEKIEFSNLGADRMVFAVLPSIVPDRQVTVEGIVFYGMKIDSIPVFIAPDNEQLSLQPGVRLTLRKPMPVTIYLRDLSSLQPLIDALSSGHVHVQGYALLDAKLDLLPSLLLRERSIHAPVPIDADLPLDVPGGPSVRDQALHALSLAETGRKLVGGTLLSLLGADQTRQNLQSQFGKSVMMAVARYKLTDAARKIYPVEKMGVAFRAGDRQAVTVRELVEPWRFDPAIAAKIEKHEMTVVPGSFDLLLWPAGSVYSRGGPAAGKPEDAAAMSLGKKDFRIVDTGVAATERAVSAEVGTGASLVATVPRASVSNVALLEFAEAPKIGPPVNRIDSGPAPADGYSVLVAFRFAAGSFTQTADPEIVRLSGRVVNGRLQLDDPIDASALGSPLLSDGGLVGILQDESSALPFAAAAAKLKLGASARGAAARGAAAR